MELTTAQLGLMLLRGAAFDDEKFKPNLLVLTNGNGVVTVRVKPLHCKLLLQN